MIADTARVRVAADDALTLEQGSLINNQRSSHIISFAPKALKSGCIILGLQFCRESASEFSFETNYYRSSRLVNHSSFLLVQIYSSYGARPQLRQFTTKRVRPNLELYLFYSLPLTLWE